MPEQYNGLLPDPVAVARRIVRLPLQLARTPLRHVPYGLQARVLETALNRVFAEALAEGRLDFLDGRCLALIVEDLGYRWPFSVRDGRIIVLTRRSTHDAAIRASARSFITLAARSEDADSAFFRRALHMDGNVELAMALRHLLDELPAGSAAPPAMRLARAVAEVLQTLWPDDDARPAATPGTPPPAA